MRTLSRIAVIGLTLAPLAGFQGCALVAAGAVGAAGYAYYDGEMRSDVDASPQKIVSASAAALKELDIPVQSQDATSVDGRVEGKTALDKKVTVSVKRKSDTTSSVGIRVGTFGDEELSRRILDGIKAHL